MLCQASSQVSWLKVHQTLGAEHEVFLFQIAELQTVARRSAATHQTLDPRRS